MAFSEKETLALDVMEACQLAVGVMESNPGSKVRNRAGSRLWSMIDAAMSGDEARQRAALADLKTAI
jgi:hypothetical protein